MFHMYLYLSQLNRGRTSRLLLLKKMLIGLVTLQPTFFSISPIIYFIMMSFPWERISIYISYRALSISTISCLFVNLHSRSLCVFKGLRCEAGRIFSKRQTWPAPSNKKLVIFTSRAEQVERDEQRRWL